MVAILHQGRVRREPKKKKSVLAFYRIPFAYPLRKACHVSVDLCVPESTRCDRSLHARVSPEAPAIKHEGRVLYFGKDEFEGKKLFLRYKERSWYATPGVFQLGSCINDHQARVSIHHLLQFFRRKVRKILLESARAYECDGDKEQKKCDASCCHATF